MFVPMTWCCQVLVSNSIPCTRLNIVGGVPINAKTPSRFGVCRHEMIPGTSGELEPTRNGPWWWNQAKAGKMMATALFDGGTREF